MSSNKKTSQGTTKVDLRRLMQMKKQDMTSTSKRIDSPLAKYSSSGQLTCVVCRTAVKSEAAWPAHLASRIHRNSVEALRRQQTTGKRAAADPPPPPVQPPPKRHKGKSNVPGDFFDKATAPRPPPKKGILKNAAPLRASAVARPSTASRVPPTFVPATLTSTAGDNEPMDVEAAAATGGPATLTSTADDKEPMDVEGAAATDGIAAFRASGAPVWAGSAATAATAAAAADSSAAAHLVDEPTSGQLPEGFFDDPAEDAKARHVEYVDPVEAEWARFQREMASAAAESELILDEDQQEATVGRQLEEVEEQMRNLSRVLDIDKKKQILSQHEECSAAAGDTDSDSDDADVDEFLDWRSKGTWK